MCHSSFAVRRAKLLWSVLQRLISFVRFSVLMITDLSALLNSSSSMVSALPCLLIARSFSRAAVDSLLFGAAFSSASWARYLARGSTSAVLISVTSISILCFLREKNAQETPVHAGISQGFPTLQEQDTLVVNC